MFRREPVSINGEVVEVGKVLNIQVVKNKSYFSPKSQNGCEDITFSSNELEDYLTWNYIGTTIRKRKKCAAFLLSEAQFLLPLEGAKGYVNAIEIMNNVCGLFKLDGMLDISNISISEMLQMYGVSIKDEDLERRIFAYGKNDYSPESFLRGEFEKEGKIEEASNSWICSLEEDIQVQSNTPHWLATQAKNIVSKDKMLFCVGVYFNAAISPNYDLFSTNGEEIDGCFGVRPIAYFPIGHQEEEKTYSSLTEIIQDKMELYGIVARNFINI